MDKFADYMLYAAAAGAVLLCVAITLNEGMMLGKMYRPYLIDKQMNLLLEYEQFLRKPQPRPSLPTQRLA